MAWSLSVGAAESQNPSGNTSYVSATAYLSWSSWESFANFDQEVYITIGGNGSGAIAIPRQVNYPNAVRSGTIAIGSHGVTFTHDVNGYRGAVGTSASLDGDGGYGPPDLSAGGPTFGAIDYVRLPSAPSSATAVAVGPIITVTCGEASTPGPTIDAYKVSYASSSNGGATWSSWSETEQTMTSRSYTYSSLTPGFTYKFRVRAHNGDGDGPYVESNTVFAAAGGKRRTSTDWALTVGAAKRYTGSAWTPLTTLKRYDDVTDTWVSLS